MLVKVQFLRNGKLAGRRYTCKAGKGLSLQVGDKVLAGNNSIAQVVEVNVPEEEGAAFGDRLRTIDVKYIDDDKEPAAQEDGPLFADDEPLFADEFKEGQTA